MGSATTPAVEHTARVYDLDGTLVRLRVDWEAAAADVRGVYADAGIEVATDEDLWSLLERAEENGLRDEVGETIAAHEREGARRADRLPAADDLDCLGMPVAVCSLNAEAACRIALETHGLLDHVDAVVGRDSVETYKPDPEPLLAAVRALSARPADTLFVGDSERDAECARRAGTQFRYVDGVPSGH